ncbi:MAG: ABC transporter substrate-binding protein [Clostridia bacterium]
MKRFSKILAVLLVLCLTIGGLSAVALAEDVVTLRWVTVGGGTPKNYDAWLEKINPYLAEKIGVNIAVEVVPWGDWDNRRSVIVNTSGEYDILFTNTMVYNSDVMVGAFADITDLIGTAAPELQAMIPASYWDACRINGKIFAVPTYKDSSQTEYIVWDKDLLDKLSLDASEVHTFEAMTPLLAAIKESTGEASFPMNKNGASYLPFMYDQMNAGLPTLGVRYDDATAKVVSVYEQEDVMANLKMLHQWYNDGIINADAATKPEENNYKPCSLAQGWSQAAVTTWGPNMGSTAVAYQWGDTVVSNETVRGSLNCISANCAHPEKALAFLQLLNTDSYVRDSFFYGLEGDDWEYTADKRVHRNNADWKMAGYTQASFFTVTPTDDVEFNQWDEVKALNEAAKPSVLLGFTFDTSKVNDQLTNCIAIFNRYKGEILTGTTNPEESVPAMMAEMKDAGFDAILTEAQAQVDAFQAAK